MVYNEAGVYEVELSATDDCGNNTRNAREVLVAREVRAGDNISVEQEGNVVTISADVCGALDECQTVIDMKDDIDGKQDELTAGSNVQISNNVISATDTTYGNATTSEAGLMSAADKAKLDAMTPDDYLTCENVLDCESVSTALAGKQNTLTAGNHITIAQDGTISATGMTREEILTELGYTEIELSLTDRDNNSTTAMVLGCIVTE